MDEINAFTSKELEANDKAPSDVVDLIQSKDAILMVGAGCLGAIYPLWSKFLEGIDETAKNVGSIFYADKKTYSFLLMRLNFVWEKTTTKLMFTFK